VKNIGCESDHLFGDVKEADDDEGVANGTETVANFSEKEVSAVNDNSHHAHLKNNAYIILTMFCKNQMTVQLNPKNKKKCWLAYHHD